MPDKVMFNDQPFQTDDTAGWVETDVHRATGVPADGRPVPFQVFANRFSSSSLDAELFLHDPLQQMKNNPGDLVRMNVQGHTGEELKNVPIEQLRDRWHVTTFIANHHRPLTAIHVHAVALVGPDGVHLMVYKQAL